MLAQMMGGHHYGIENNLISHYSFFKLGSAGKGSKQKTSLLKVGFSVIIVFDCKCSIMHCESGWMKGPDGTNADCRLCSNGCMETKSFSKLIHA